jgi:Ion channel
MKRDGAKTKARSAQRFSKERSEKELRARRLQSGTGKGGDETKKVLSEVASLKKRSLLKSIWEAESYTLVLALIILVFVLQEAAPNNAWTRAGTIVLLGAMLLIALKVARMPVGVLLTALLLIAVALAFSLAVSSEDQRLRIPRFIAAVLLVLVAVAVVLRILRHPSVNVETIYGALSVYLLIGLFFAFTDAVVGSFTPFFVAAGNDTLKDYLYFSFVTLTTLGFGDLVPRGDLSRTLVVIEAMLGQLYLVTVVALLVSNYIRRPPLPPSA